MAATGTGLLAGLAPAVPAPAPELAGFASGALLELAGASAGATAGVLAAEVGVVAAGFELVSAGDAALFESDDVEVEEEGAGAVDVAGTGEAAVAAGLLVLGVDGVDGVVGVA